MKSLGPLIRERREELDLSLREFAKKIDCSAPFVSDVELGRRFPSDETLELIAKALKLNIEDLRRADPRAPIDEIKRVTENDPRYAFAFRQALKLTPEELLAATKRKTKPK